MFNALGAPYNVSLKTPFGVSVPHWHPSNLQYSMRVFSLVLPPQLIMATAALRGLLFASRCHINLGVDEYDTT